MCFLSKTFMAQMAFKRPFLLMNWFTFYIFPLNVWLNVFFVQNVHNPAQMAFKRLFFSHELVPILCLLFKWVIICAFCPTVMAQMAFKRAISSHELVHILCFPFKCVIKCAFCPKRSWHRWHSKGLFLLMVMNKSWRNILCFPFKCVIKCVFVQNGPGPAMAFKRPFLLMNWLTFYVFLLNGWIYLLFIQC